MVTFTPSQSVWQFAKSRAISFMRASVVYMHTWKTHANFSFLCTILPLTCHQRTIFQSVTIIQLCLPKGIPIFQKLFFNFWIFQLCSTFSNFKNICAILENLSRETKNSNFDICKILWWKNLVNLKIWGCFQWCMWD